MEHTAVWFRNDLRTVDHRALLEASRRGAVTCVFCVDPRHFGVTRANGHPRTGPARTKFLLESIEDLRTGLRRLGGELVVRRGKPEDVLEELWREGGWTRLHYHRRVGTEEAEVEQRVESMCGVLGIATQSFWDLTLLDLDEMPFTIDSVPEVYTNFRKAVERVGGFTEPVPAPRAIQMPQQPLEPGDIPTAGELGVGSFEADERAVLAFAGGERAGQQRLADYFWERDKLKRYKDTRNGMVGADYSSKFSPWLAHGCLSARWIQSEVERYERERVQNKSTYWMTFELLWRDYFQMIVAKHGAACFRPEGLQGIPVPWAHDEVAFEAWRTGQTGFPIVDANMRELLLTGFQSNRGRQIVASFLTKNLGIDWRWGAEWFESQLVDHDVASNYGNWNYGAGVGNDARGFRYFDLASQADKYDRKGRHATLWCPELDPLSAREVHAPWQLPRSVQEQRGVVLGKDYPRPIVDLARSVRENKRAWEAAVRG